MNITQPVKESPCIDDLLKLINSLTIRINYLEKKIYFLESNSISNNHNNYNNNEVIIDENIFRSIPITPPILHRQNAFLS